MSKCNEKFKRWQVNINSVVVITASLFFIITTLCDRLIAPTVDVLSCTPFYIYNQRDDLKSENWPVTTLEEGIFIIVHLRNGSRPTLVSGLDVSGKIFLSPNEYLFFCDTEGRTLKEIGAEYEKRKPFILVSWVGKLTDVNGSIKLEPFEETYIRFTILEMTFSGQSETGYFKPTSDYLGFSDGTKKPKRKRNYPETTLMFKKKYGDPTYPIGMRKDLKTGELKCSIHVSSRYIEIPSNKIKKEKYLPKNDWDTKSPTLLYSLGDDIIK